MIGGVFLACAVVCFFAKRWIFGASLALPAILLLGAWQYNRTHETTSTLQLALVSQTLIKENRKQPEESVFHVTLSGLELGIWRVNLPAKNIRLNRPGQIVLVEFRKRPLAGSYVHSIASLPGE